MAVSEGINKNLFILKITANHLSLSLTSRKLNEFFHKTLFQEKLLNHKEIDYLFIFNFHGIMNNPKRLCQKDMPE